MKSLPLKLAIFVVLLFAAVIATCLLWTPVKIRYYTEKLNSDEPMKRVAGVDGFLEMGEKGKKALAEYYRCSIEEINFLQTYWDKPNTPYTKYSTYPLYTAAGQGYFSSVRLLLDKGADINADG